MRFALVKAMGCVILLLAIICCFIACGNQAILDPGNFDFKHVHCSDATEGHCVEIVKWWDNSSGIEVQLSNGEGAFFSEGTYQMFESKSDCPYCN